MFFRDVLQEIVNNIEGCLGSLIIGTDGILVDKVWDSVKQEADFDVLLAEYISLLRSAQRTNDNLGLGVLQELTLIGGMGIFILRVVNENYVIAAVLNPKGNFGRGRFELRRAELLLEKELNI